MNTLNNKYTTWYWSLIESRRHVIPTEDTHKHHIIPRSLGGTDEQSNLVNLTPREHFLAHMILSKMFSGRDKSKMIFTARQMLSHHTPCSRNYETVIKNANREMSEKWHDTEWSSKIISDRIERTKDPLVRKKMSETMFGVWERKEYRDTHSAAMKNIQTPELSESKSNNMKAIWADPEKRTRFLAARKPADEVLRQKRSVAASEGNRISWADPVIRERRIAGIKAGKAKSRAAKEAALLSEIDAFD